jgi:hypothetical protein
MVQRNQQLQLQISAAMANIKQCGACASDDSLLAAFFAPPSYGKFDVQPLSAARLQLLYEGCVRCPPCLPPFNPNPF